mmetsp:Transcript_27016/g.79829  ORF Transcript_27016/g.79829 Transcript_27016/m.79829 type:complete len:80 (+) Transcript_27016:1959-2198(+)
MTRDQVFIIGSNQSYRFAVAYFSGMAGRHLSSSVSIADLNISLLGGSIGVGKMAVSALAAGAPDAHQVQTCSSYAFVIV